MRKQIEVSNKVLEKRKHELATISNGNTSEESSVVETVKEARWISYE